MVVEVAVDLDVADQEALHWAVRDPRDPLHLEFRRRFFIGKVDVAGLSQRPFGAINSDARAIFSAHV